MKRIKIKTRISRPTVMLKRMASIIFIVVKEFINKIINFLKQEILSS